MSLDVLILLCEREKRAVDGGGERHRKEIHVNIYFKLPRFRTLFRRARCDADGKGFRKRTAAAATSSSTSRIADDVTITYLELTRTFRVL